MCDKYHNINITKQGSMPCGVAIPGEFVVSEIALIG